MDESIDYNAVIAQLQLENEALRRHMRAFTEVRETIYKVPTLLEEMYRKVTSNKYAVLVGLLIIYWAVSIAVMIYDRFPRGGTS